MDHTKKARELFLEGYNCSQAVFCAFTDLTGMDLDTAARLSSSFGGGMGRLREVCGTVSGALLVLGLICGYDDPQDIQAKTAHYHLVQEYARRFRQINASIICRDLLKGAKVTAGDQPEPRTPEFYSSRPCLRLVEEAAQIADEILETGKSLQHQD